MTKVHANTKIDRELYNSIKSMKSDKFTARRIAQEILNNWEVSVSQSTINSIGRSKNFKQYRLSHKRAKISPIVFSYRVSPIYEIHWYSNIPVLRTWIRWIGGKNA